MNILILSSSDPYRTAGVVAKDLFDGLRDIPGNRVELVVKSFNRNSDANIKSIDSFYSRCKDLISRKFIRILEEVKIKKYPEKTTDPNYCIHDIDQTISYYSTETIFNKVKFTPDAIIVIFMHKYLSLKNLYELSNNTKSPIFVLMPDMAIITGGCHYAWRCEGYLDKCGKCPGMYSNAEKDSSRINWEYKYEYISKTNITAIAASEFQWRQLQACSLFSKKEKVKILSPTNEDLFYPSNKEVSRKKLNLPIDKNILLFGAVNTIEKRKGYKELVHSLEMLYNKLSSYQRDKVLIVIVGKANKAYMSDIPFNIHFAGYLTRSDLSLAYQSSDIFLNTSIEDSGPTMINQAIMSGLPVVAFEMGVAPDLVKNGVTGYMAGLYNTEQYADGIKEILELSDDDYMKMSINCRELAQKTCSCRKVASDFQLLIQNREKTT